MVCFIKVSSRVSVVPLLVLVHILVWLITASTGPLDLSAAKAASTIVILISLVFIRNLLLVMNLSLFLVDCCAVLFLVGLGVVFVALLVLTGTLILLIL